MRDETNEKREEKNSEQQFEENFEQIFCSFWFFFLFLWFVPAIVKVETLKNDYAYAIFSMKNERQKLGKFATKELKKNSS